MATISLPPKAQELVAMLDKAVEADNFEAIAENVKNALVHAVDNFGDFLPEELLATNPDHYARHLMHMDPQKRYSIIIMVWGTGQGTPLHDHAGMWCVECCYKGEIEVVSYDIQGKDEDIPVQFKQEAQITAKPGEAGALIPPFDYHTIANHQPTPSVTIHVYGGDMTWCHAFMPIEGGYQRVRKELTYTK